MHLATMKRKRLVVLLAVVAAAVLALSSIPIYADATAVGARFAENHDRAVASLKQLSADDKLNSQTALETIKRDMSPMMNYDKLASTAVGKYWRKATDAEKAEVIAAFQRVLERNFSRVLSKFSDQEVALLESKQQADGKVSVLTEVRGNKTAKIEYIFTGIGAEDKIVDVKVEGVSLLANYRRQFRNTLKKDGVAGLIVQLKKLTAK